MFYLICIWKPLNLQFSGWKMQGGEDTLDFLMYLFLLKFDIKKKIIFFNKQWECKNNKSLALLSLKYLFLKYATCLQI